MEPVRWREYQELSEKILMRRKSSGYDFPPSDQELFDHQYVLDEFWYCLYRLVSRSNSFPFASRKAGNSQPGNGKS